MSSWFKGRFGEGNKKSKRFQQAKSSTGSIDPALEIKVASFQQLDVRLKDVHRHVQLYLHQLTELCSSGVSLSESLLLLFTATGSLHLQQAATEFQRVQSLINSYVRGAVHRTVSERILRPTGKLLNTMPQIHKQIEMKKRVEMEFDNVRSQLQAETLKDHASEMTLQPLSAKFAQIHSSLVQLTEDIENSLQRLEDDQQILMMPEFSSLVGCQAMFYKASSEAVMQMFPLLPQSASTLCILSSRLHHERIPFTSHLAPSPKSSRSIQGTDEAEAFSDNTLESFERNLPDPNTTPIQNIPESHPFKQKSSAAPISKSNPSNSRKKLVETPLFDRRGRLLDIKQSASLSDVMYQRKSNLYDIQSSPMADLGSRPIYETPQLIAEAPGAGGAAGMGEEEELGELVPFQLFIATAVASFNPDCEGSLSFERGDVIKVLREEKGGWLFGRTGGREGKFPANFVEEVEGFEFDGRM